MAMVQTNTFTEVRTKTRVEMRLSTAQAFLDLATDQGYDAGFYVNRLDLLIRMELVCNLKMFIFSGRKAVSGIAMRIDHAKGDSEMERHGEDFAPELIDQYGLSGSITDMLSALRTYVSGLFAQGGATHIEVWYTFSNEALAQYGHDRLCEMIGVEDSPAIREATRERYAEIVGSIGSTESRATHSPDLSEYTFETWKQV